MLIPRTIISLGLTAAGLAGGCQTGPRYQTPAVSLPDAFTEPLPGTAATQPTTGPSAGPATRPVDLARWWESLDDAELNSLVNRAIRNGFDVSIAIARVQQARALELSTVGGNIPGIGGLSNLQFTAVAARGTGNDSTRGRVPGPINAAVNTKDLAEVTHAFGLDASWEIDLFGRTDRLIEAARADTQAAIEARNEVLISVVADVARAYIQLRSLQYRLSIAERFVQSEQRTTDLVRSRLNRGLGARFDVVLAERELSAAQSHVPPLQAAIAAVERRIAVLLGQLPETLHNELEKPCVLPALPPGISAGMPVALLRRRPDIRQAERQLAASVARIGLATADFFPRVVLSAGVGAQGQGLGRTPVTISSIYSIGPALYWPLLDFGRLDAALLQQKYRERESFESYRRTVIDAIREVDDGITNYAADQSQLARLSDSVRLSRSAVKLATERFQNGMTDFLNVLDAERELDDLEDQYAVVGQAVADQYVSLYKALGGGWEGYELPPTPQPRIAVLAAGEILLRGNPVVPGADN